jgi:hypothetical protein
MTADIAERKHLENARFFDAAEAIDQQDFAGFASRTGLSSD